MAAHRFTYARDALRASDPDLGRFRMGARALVAAVAAALVLTSLARLAGVPTALSLIGIDVAILGALLVNDPEPRAQRVTQLLVPVVAAASTVVGTLLAPFHLLGSLAFLVVMFAAVAVRRIGPRGMALGMIAFITFFLALFFHVPAEALPICLAGVAIAGVIAYVVRFALIVDRPVAIARGLRDSLVRSVALGLERLARRLEGSGTDRAVARALRRTNDVGLVLDDHLDSPGARAIAEASADELRAHAFEAEVALERLATALASFASGDRRLAALLRRTRYAIRDGYIDACAGDLDAELAALAVPSERAWQRVQSAFHDVVAGVRGLRGVRIEPATVPRRVPEREEPPAEPGMHPATRQAIQATIAGGLAMVAGSLISTTRWYWAVIAAFVMFTRATTRGESLVRGVERVVGTAIGVIGGVWLGSWLSGHSRIELAVVFFCVFVAYYFLQSAYTGMVIALTLLLSALYGLLGRFSPGILYLRLAETVAGCAIGAGVAVFVLPSSTHGKLRATVDGLLRELADLLEAAFAGASPAAAESLRDQARDLDRRLRDLRVASRPLVGPFMHVGWEQPSEIVHLVSTAWYFARHLVLHAGAPLEPVARDVLDVLAHQVAANARAAVDGGPLDSAADDIARARDAIVAAGMLGAGPSSPRAALDRLARVDAALVEIAALLSAGALEPRARRWSRGLAHAGAR